MKGIILAGGTGSRLNPITQSISKQLLPVYNKPMIYYPSSLLMLAGIKDILIISSEEHLPLYKKLFNDGEYLGLNINYQKQKYPNGIAEALIIGKKFINNDDVSLILGDNIFFGSKVKETLINSIKITKEKQVASLFGKFVNNPLSYGVAKFNHNHKIIKIIEKPKSFISNIALTGLYCFPKDINSKVKLIKPSKRNELEITDINNLYIRENRINFEIFDRGQVWFDMGTPDNLVDASLFVQSIEKRQNQMIGCLEEIAFKNKFISRKDFIKLINNFKNNFYKSYLENLIK